MNISEEWRPRFPTTYSTHAPPLLPRADPAATAALGPIFFHPLPATLKPLLSSPSLYPPSLPPPPSLSMPRYLETFSSSLPATSTNISATFLAGDPLMSSIAFSRNRLEPLPYPDGRSTLAFFPTGDNDDCIGYVLLLVSGSELCVEGAPFVSSKSFGHRIIQLSACSHVGAGEDDDCVGFLMASTMYSVHWFRVEIVGRGSQSPKPVLVYLGGKVFKSSSVAHVCWNPHLTEESLVLLENGHMFLFNANGSGFGDSIVSFKGKRLPVSWDQNGSLAKGGWFSCEFSWHPRALVVANSDAVFFVDLRFEKCIVSCLMKVELLGVTDAVETDRFATLSKAGSEGIYFAVASDCWLVLLDIRSPCNPALQWVHSHRSPCYMSVFNLSKLRENPGNDEYNQASEKGFAIVLGSFWTGDFSLFCYGPSLVSLKHPISSNKRHKVYEPYYAWDVPSNFILSGLDCPCSSCLVRDELTKDDLPEWVDWHQKKKLVLGFFILDDDISSVISKPDNAVGFTLIKLTSSGSLESQRYNACWDMPRKLEPAHEESPMHAKDFHLCSMDDVEYNFPRKFKYVRLNYLYAHMTNALTRTIFLKFGRFSDGSGRSTCSIASSRESLTEKLKLCGLTGSTSSLSVSDAVRDISMPTSVYEAASKVLWTRLPLITLEMAFPSYEECFGVVVDNKKVFMDFSVVPDDKQLPPFVLRKLSNRSNKWSKRVKPNGDCVGPVIPLPVSLALKEISENGRSYLEKVNQFSPDAEVGRESQTVLHALREICVWDSNINVVSLGDSEDTCSGSESKSMFLYKPSTLSAQNGTLNDPARYTTMVAKLSNNKHVDNERSSSCGEFFEELCPIDLKFDDPSDWNISPKEMRSYSILKDQFVRWQQGFQPYADFCEQLLGKGQCTAAQALCRNDSDPHLC